MILAIGMAVALLTGCGQNSSSIGTNKPSPTPTATTGPVTLQIGAPSYHPNETIEVTLSNSGASTIYFPDHLTNCMVIQLQRQVNGNWEIVQKCLLMIVTRIHSLDSRQRLMVNLVPAHNRQWLTGFYRATLSYRTSLEGSAPTFIYSAEFQVS